tara:strand:- start:77 stop:295 length:219 start_codon:yes stop_codon:yes gene_type:complete
MKDPGRRTVFVHTELAGFTIIVAHLDCYLHRLDSVIWLWGAEPFLCRAAFGDTPAIFFVVLHCYALARINGW